MDTERQRIETDIFKKHWFTQTMNPRGGEICDFYPLTIRLGLLSFSMKYYYMFY